MAAVDNYTARCNGQRAPLLCCRQWTEARGQGRGGGAKGGGGGVKVVERGLTHSRQLFIVSPKIEHLTPFKERARRSVIRPKVLHLVCKPNAAALMKKMGRKDDKISMLFAPHSDDDDGGKISMFSSSFLC